MHVSCCSLHLENRETRTEDCLTDAGAYSYAMAHPCDEATHRLANNTPPPSPRVMSLLIKATILSAYRSHIPGCYHFTILTPASSFKHGNVLLYRIDEQSMEQYKRPDGCWFPPSHLHHVRVAFHPGISSIHGWQGLA